MENTLSLYSHTSSTKDVRFPLQQQPVSNSLDTGGGPEDELIPHTSCPKPVQTPKIPGSMPQGFPWPRHQYK